MDDTGRVAIFWDFEACRPPFLVDGVELVEKIQRIAHTFGEVTLFKTYVDLAKLASSRAPLRSELHACGVSVVDCPRTNRKDVTDKMIAVDMMVFAMDNPAPSTLVLLSGDADFAYPVSILRLRKYHVVVIAPSATDSSTSIKYRASIRLGWERDVLDKSVTSVSVGHGLDIAILPTAKRELDEDGNRPSKRARVLGGSCNPHIPASPEVGLTTAVPRHLQPPMHTASTSMSSMLRADTVASGAGAEQEGDGGSSVAAELSLESMTLISIAQGPAIPVDDNEVSLPVETAHSDEVCRGSVAERAEGELLSGTSLPDAKQEDSIEPGGPADDQPEGSTHHTSTKEAREVPAQFHRLVELLERARMNGDSAQGWSILGRGFAKDPIASKAALQSAGVPKFRKYVHLAEKAGIVKVMRTDAHEPSVCLAPEWHGKVVIEQDPEEVQRADFLRLLEDFL